MKNKINKMNDNNMLNDKKMLESLINSLMNTVSHFALQEVLLEPNKYSGI